MRRINYIRVLLVYFTVFGWVLSFPYEGPVLYAFIESSNLNLDSITHINIFTHAIGLLLGGFIIRDNHSSKKLLYNFLLISFIVTAGLLLGIDVFIYLVPFTSFFIGVFMSSLGIYLKAYIPKKDRTKVVGSILISGNVVLIFADILASNISYRLGLAFVAIMLMFAMYSFAKLRISEENYEEYKTDISFNKSFWLFYLFIFVISINSGMMFAEIYPFFGQMSLIRSIYTNIPYIVAILVLVFLNRNKFYFLFLGLAMWFIVFVLFIFAEPNLVFFILIITLMLFACGIYDTFWWSIMANNVDKSPNPIMFIGFGLFANLAGVLTGSVIGSTVMDLSHDQLSIAIIGIIVSVISMLTIIPLNINLINKSDILDFLMYKDSLEITSDKPQDILNEKEYEVFRLLMQNLSNKDISEKLILSINTIKYHNKNIYHKLEVKNKKELIKKYN